MIFILLSMIGVQPWKNQTEITVSGNHFVQEDSSEEIGAALREFTKDL